MLIYKERNQTFKTTDKGMYFLNIYNEVQELVTPTGVQALVCRLFEIIP